MVSFGVKSLRREDFCPSTVELPYLPGCLKCLCPGHTKCDTSYLVCTAPINKMPLTFREDFPGHTIAGFIIDASVNSIDCGNHPWLRSGNHNANGSDNGQVGSLCPACRQLNFE